MRIRFLLLSLFFIIVNQQLESKTLDVDINCEAAILINASTGAILYEKNAHQPYYPASITKIATALYTFVQAQELLDEKVKASREALVSITKEAKERSHYNLPSYWIESGAQHIGICVGEEFLLRDLLGAMLIVSACDASNVIAKYVGGSIPKFVRELNQYIKSLGCQTTYFKNPHGLHHPQQVTTAFEMALIAKEAMRYPDFRKIVASNRYVRPKTNKKPLLTCPQTNKLMRRGPYFYPHAIGIKTGYTSQSGENLVAAAKVGERELIAVLLRAPKRQQTFEDAIKLFNQAFSQKKEKKIFLKKGKQRFIVQIPGASRKLKTYLQEDLDLEYFPAEAPDVKVMILWNQDLKAPIKKWQQVGVAKLISSKEKREYRKVPIYALNDVKLSLSQRVQTGFKKHLKQILFVIGVLSFVWIFFAYFYFKQK